MGPWVVGDKLPRLVVHVGEAIVEVGAEVSVDIVNVKLSCICIALYPSGVYS